MRRPPVVLAILACLAIAPAAHAGTGDVGVTATAPVDVTPVDAVPVDVTPVDAVPVDTVSPAIANLECASPAIVKPNCGVEPEQAGDRGGALQYTVWALLVVGLIVVFTVVFRSARRTNVARRAEVGERKWS